MHEVDVAAGGAEATLTTLAVVVVDELALLVLFFGVAMSVAFRATTWDALELPALEAGGPGCAVTRMQPSSNITVILLTAVSWNTDIASSPCRGIVYQVVFIRIRAAG